MRQGQLFSSDLAISIMVFLTMFGTVMLAAGQTFDSDAAIRQQEVMGQRAEQASSLLVRTKGYPEGWNRSNVRVAGLASRGQLLNNTKLSELRLIPNYRAQREAVGVLPSEMFITATRNGSTVKIQGRNGAGGLGDGAVAVIVESGSENINDHAFIDAVNRSTMTWDLYWPSTERDGLDALTARTVYNYTTDSPTMADDLFRNLSTADYRSVLTEDMEVVGDQNDEGDGNQVTEQALLEDFVNQGGTLIHAGSDPIFIKNLFGLGATSEGDESAYVKEESAVLNESLGVGDTFEFSNSPMAFAESDAVFVNGTEDPNCLVCRWDIGAGKVFYVADTYAGDDGPAVFRNGTAAFTGMMRLIFGRPVPADATQVAASKRLVLVDSVDGLKQARLRLIVWR